jgi:hypothetical protein
LIADQFFGWREDYNFMGIIGVLFGILGVFTLGEVEKKCET